MSNVYPKSVLERLQLPKHAGSNDDTNSVGISVAFECGTYVSFELTIEQQSKLIEKIVFRSNGCGFMIAAADILAAAFEGKHLIELNALTEERQLLSESLGDIPSNRQHCRDVVVAAIEGAFADFRRRQVEEFSGEKPLICSCFGVTEEIIEAAIRENLAKNVKEVGQLCKAGTGCGSCQMMIREIIDTVTNLG